MQQHLNILRGRPWLMLLLMLAWLMPQQASATYVDDAANYTVRLGGTNIVYFTAPVYDTSDSDTWIEKGQLKVTPEGGSTQTIFQWESETDINNSNTTLSCKFTTDADGFFDITLGNSNGTSRLTKSNGGNRTLVRNSDGKTFEFAAEWVVPYNMLGKKLTFTWEVNRNGNGGRSAETVKNLKSVTINMPAAASKLKPFVAAPMLNPRNPGKLELPWYLASDSITKAYYEYEDATGKKQKVDINNMSSGTIMLDANVPYRKFHIVCSYKEKGDKGEYEIENVSSSTHNLAIIHAPVGLTARALDEQKAKVELKWTVPYVDDEDLVPTDFFEVQRSMTGKEEDFVTIGQLFYSKNDKKRVYTFIDSTLVDDILAEHAEEWRYAGQPDLPCAPYHHQGVGMDRRQQLCHERPLRCRQPAPAAHSQLFGQVGGRAGLQRPCDMGLCQRVSCHLGRPCPDGAARHVKKQGWRGGRQPNLYARPERARTAL